MTIVVLSVANYRYWPSGKYQDYAFLLFNQSSLEVAFEKSKSVNFDRISWCKDFPKPDSKIVSVTTSNPDTGAKERTELNWETDDSFRPLFEAFEATSASCVHVFRWKDNILMQGSSDVEVLSESADAAMKLLETSRHYTLGAVQNIPSCKSLTDRDEKFGQCFEHMFGDWNVVEEWTLRDHSVIYEVLED
jgi:hypothetical protein